jgi:uncharacterized glyoxalase superfamily protein PhnB
MGTVIHRSWSATAQRVLMERFQKVLEAVDFSSCRSTNYHEAAGKAAEENEMQNNQTTLIPHLACRNAAEAVEFYKKAFGAEAPCVMQLPDGRLMHAAVSIRGATFYLADEFPECGGKSPQSLGGSPVSLHLQVPDCEEVFARAVEAGCTVTMPLADMFWGDRYGMVTDPYGHNWSIATTVKELSPEEMQKAMEEMACIPA